MPKYTATTPIKHDGKHYGVGDKITLDMGDAQALLAAGAVEDSRDSAAERKAQEKADAERKAAEQADADRLAAQEAEAAAARAKAQAEAAGAQGQAEGA